MAGQIAQLVIPAGVRGNPLVIPDWQGGKIYVLDWRAKYTYSTALVTQTAPLLTVSVSPNREIWGADIDPVTGYLLIQQANADGSTSGAVPVFKVDPATFADVASFGGTTTTASWPTSILGSDAIVCVGCGTQASGGAVQVGYCVIKENLFSSNGGVIRTDTMQQAGFYRAVVSGATNGRGFMCRGAFGPTGASVFLSWNAQTTPAPTVPLYSITITPGAEFYNPASWPTTNPHILWRTVGTIPAASVDPTWSNLATNSLGYDREDGNVLMAVGTTDAVAQRRYLIKLNANTAAIVWKTPLPATVADPGLPSSSIDHSIAGLIGTTAYGLAATDTGILTTASPFNLTQANDFYVGSNQQTSNTSTDTAGLFFVSVTNYDSTRSGAPTPVAGTPSTFSTSFALIGGLIPVFVPPGGGGGPGGGGLRLAMDNVSVTAQATLLPKNLISLRWSDDRGHTWGHPVAIPMGEAGEYRTSLQWQRLAYARDRVFELYWDVPCRTALQGCWIDVTPAQS